MPKTLAIIQARHTSTRFPGKVDEIIGSHTMWYQVLKRASMAVVSTMAWSCDYLPDIDENDVLQRYWAVAAQHQPDIIIRLTSDCPLIEPSHILWVLGLYQGKPVMTSPAWDGFDVEVFSWSDLLRVKPRDAYDREHVTSYLRRECDVLEVPLDPPIHFSVNTRDDLRFVREVYRSCEHCSHAVPHHTNAASSIGGGDRHPVWDLHQTEDGGLAECKAYDILRGRIG